MRMSVDWKNITIKGADILKFAFWLVSATFVVTGVYNKLNTIISNQEISSITLKEYGIRISNIELEQKLMKQDIENFKMSTREFGIKTK